MVSNKVVTPVETGVQKIYNYLKGLDSGWRRNDRKTPSQTFSPTAIKDCPQRGGMIFSIQI